MFMKIMSAFYFGPYVLNNKQIFYESAHCLVLTRRLIMQKPIVPGHVLVIPKRVVPRYSELSAEEVAELYLNVHKMAPLIQKRYDCQALNIAMQDGKEAGQSVPHVHIHILPRRAGDFSNNDDIYEHLENQKLDAVLESAERVARTVEDMGAEAADLMTLFPDNIPAYVTAGDA